MKNNDKKQNILNGLFSLGLFIIFGFIAGIMMNRYSKNEGINYILISSIFFTIIGLIKFIIVLLKNRK